MGYKDILTGPEIPPAIGDKPEQVVVFLHGVGANGDDLISLAPYMQDVLPKAHFISPNAPHDYDMAPAGYQWFSLSDRSPHVLLKGVELARDVLDKYLDAILDDFQIKPDQLIIIGFSQGTMAGLYTVLRRLDAIKCMVGFSGMLLGDDNTAEQVRSRPPLLLVHGAADEVVPAEMLDYAAAALEELNIPVEAHKIDGLAHGIDDQALFLAKNFLKEHLSN